MPSYRESERRKQRYRESLECPMHAYAKHGKEAEELRQGIRRIIEGQGKAEYMYDSVSEGIQAVCEELEKLLEDVDARDSLAYLERRPPKR